MQKKQLLKKLKKKINQTYKKHISPNIKFFQQLKKLNQLNLLRLFYDCNIFDHQARLIIRNTYRNLFITFSLLQTNHKFKTLSNGLYVTGFEKHFFKSTKYHIKKILKRIAFYMKINRILYITIYFFNYIKLRYKFYFLIKQSLKKTIKKILFFPKYSHGGCRPRKQKRN